jgi:ferric-dicitrate binding protein FerR (iron transport regulator)
MSRNKIEDLLDSYLKGETTIKENEQIERWLEANGNVGSEWETLNRAAKDKWLAGVFGDIKHTIHANKANVIIMPKRKPILWRSIAAAAVILLVSSILYLQWPVIQQRLHPPQLTALTAGANQKKQVTLADGSRVWVNAGSELKYPKTFNSKIREVYLSGEAYFDIAHDAAKPFIIHTGNVVTTVLGTAFNIKEDKEKHTVQVTVTRGKVSVANGGRLLGVLTPNQQISFNGVKGNVIKGTVDAQQVIAWQQTELHFEDVSFADAAEQLQQRFNVKISFSNDKLKNCRFTGTSLNGEQLYKILNVICAFNNATYKKKADGSILIDGPGCN